MARTKLNLNPQASRGFKQLQICEKAEAIAHRGSSPQAPPFRWHSGDLEARVDLEDKTAVYEKLDRES